MVVKGETKTLALVSKYSPPDPELLRESFNTLWAFKKQAEGAFTIIDVNTIISVVCIAPLSKGPEGIQFLCEKPGLDVAHIGGQDEELTEE